MYYQSLDILIQHCFGKFFLINQSYLLSSKQSFDNNIKSLIKFLFQKWYTDTIKNQKKYIQYYLYIGVS